MKRLTGRLGDHVDNDIEIKKDGETNKNIDEDVALGCLKYQMLL